MGRRLAFGTKLYMALKVIGACMRGGTDLGALSFRNFGWQHHRSGVIRSVIVLFTVRAFSSIGRYN